MRDEEKIELLRDMMRIRIFEEKVLELIERKELELGFHLLMGHEGVMTGVSKALRKDDYFTSNHRTMGRYLSRGGDPKKIMAEIFGKETGLCKGKAGEMLIADRGIGLLFSSVTVAAGIPVAVGAALALKRIPKNDKVVACFFGDGATCNGIFHEAMNVAAVHKAPVLFVCENNGLSINIPQNEWMSTRTVAEKASAYGMHGERVDGTDVEAVNVVARDAVARARSGSGPTLIDATTIRLRPHKEGLADNRTMNQMREEWKRDPIGLYISKLEIEGTINKNLVNEMKMNLGKEIDEAVEYAKAGSFPQESELMDNLYSEQMSNAFARTTPPNQ
jgi:acetoin:2,6-dichlorophenolindophenol oxidoreductase subunit alpha